MRSNQSVNEKAAATVNVEAKVIRGEQSWLYIYMAFGFWLAIGGTIIQMIAPLKWPWNLIVYVVFIAFSFWLFFNGWFQNKLIGLKNRYEAKAR